MAKHQMNLRQRQDMDKILGDLELHSDSNGQLRTLIIDLQETEVNAHTLLSLKRESLVYT